MKTTLFETRGTRHAAHDSIGMETKWRLYHGSKVNKRIQVPDSNLEMAAVEYQGWGSGPHGGISRY